MSIPKALDIMDGMVGLAIDPDCLRALRRALETIDVNLAA